jgi:Pathogenicity locus
MKYVLGERGVMAKTKDEISGGVVQHNEAVVRLQEIPNVGPKMAADLIKLGVTSLEDATGRDPNEMYHELCAIDAKRHDPCVRDIFAAVVSHAEGGPARPWWEFTPERKARDAVRERARGEEER